jgi:hypothetical protein
LYRTIHVQRSKPWRLNLPADVCAAKSVTNALQTRSSWATATVRDCQKATGTAYEAAIGIPAATLKVTGNVKYYDNQDRTAATSSVAASAPSAVRAY